MTTSIADKLGPNETTPRNFRKSAQWAFALVLLVAVVFVVTFAIQYWNIGNQTDNAKDPVPQLTCEVRQFPPNWPSGSTISPGVFPVMLSAHQSYHHDFWFENTNSQAVEIGITPTCKCSSLEVYLIPEAGKKEVADARGALAALNVCKPLANLAAAAPLGDIAPAARKYVQDAEMHTITSADHMTVPPGAVGWIRYILRGKEASTERTDFPAKVWMTRVGGDIQATFDLHVIVQYRHPLRVAEGDRHRMLGGDNGLSPIAEEPHVEYVIVWSPVLEHPDLVAEVVGLAGDPQADFFQIGKPAPLDAALCALLATEVKDVVRSAFKLPLIIRAKAGDGKTPIDYGRFRRRVRLNLKDGVEADNIDLLVEGRVNGPLDIRSGSQAVEVLDFLSFNRKDGVTREVVVHADPKLKLTVDQNRTAKFLMVALEPLPEEPGSWKLQVTVKKDAVKGRFSDEFDSEYRDCAVYLHPGDDPRCYRLPVTGTGLND